MNIEVRLYGALRRYRPAAAPGGAHAPFVVVLPPGATVATLGRRLGIPDGFLSAAAVNDQAVEESTALVDGDRVALFPPSAGGAPYKTNGGDLPGRISVVDAAPVCL